MSINWVMLHPTEGFVPLQNERTLYTAPLRTTFSLQTPNKYPGRAPLSIKADSGKLYLTNQRVIYLPASNTEEFRSFAAPLLNLRDSFVNAPIFGANSWNATLQPVPGGGLPAVHAALELKMVFKDGGAFDFHTKFEEVKDRLRQVVELARENGQISGDGSETGQRGGAYSAVNFSNIDLEQLPAYEATNSNSNPIPQPASSSTNVAPNINGMEPPQESIDAAEQHPSQPPPGYEEVQSSSVADELERRLRRESNQGDSSS